MADNSSKVAKDLPMYGYGMDQHCGVFGELFCLAMMLPPEKRFHGKAVLQHRFM